MTALVIIKTQIRELPCPSPPRETTNAGLYCRVFGSVYGKGTRTTSPCLKLGIALTIGFAVPLAKSGEWIVCRSAVRLRQDDALSFDLV